MRLKEIEKILDTLTEGYLLIGSDIQDARVFYRGRRIETQPFAEVAQMTVRGKGFILRTEERADDLHGAFDIALEKMQCQIDRYKGKHYHGRGDGRTAAEVVVEDELPVDETGELLPMIARRKEVPMEERNLETVRNVFERFGAGDVPGILAWLEPDVEIDTLRSVNVAASPLFVVKKGVGGDTRAYRVFRDAEVEACFAERGFRATGRRPQFFFPMALHRALGVPPLSRALEGAAQAFGLVRMFGSPVILRLERHG